MGKYLSFGPMQKLPCGCPKWADTKFTSKIFKMLCYAICYEKKESVRKFFELNSINCASAGFLKVSMVYHGFYNRKKNNGLKNYILEKIIFQYFFDKVKIFDNSLLLCVKSLLHISKMWIHYIHVLLFKKRAVLDDIAYIWIQHMDVK